MKFSEIFCKLTDFETVRPHQMEALKKISELSSEGKVPKLYVKLPCAYGKTELATIPFLYQWVANDFSLAARMIYVLPMRVLCEQVKKRIENYAKKAEQISKRKIIVKLHHGAVPLDPFFFADISVTTLDQFLYAYVRETPLVGRHHDLPAGSIALSYVVFDEAHMYSPYTHALMHLALKILDAARIPFVVMTATMPRSLEKELLMDDIKMEKVIYNKDIHKEEEERDIEYQLYNEEILENNELNHNVLDILRTSSGKKLIILNTVKRAQEVFKQLQKHNFQNTFLIHSRFTLHDRREHEKEVVKSLGKKALTSDSTVVSTQVCEVGLDISCNIMITECAPADCLAQRIGRVARWGGDGMVHIFKTHEPARPYEDRFVRKTFNFLQNQRVNFTEWFNILEFVDVMDYHINMRLASDSLRQLIDATMFASGKKGEFYVREEENIRLVISEELTRNPEIVESEIKIHKILDNNVAPAPQWLRDILWKRNEKFLIVKYCWEKEKYVLQEVNANESLKPYYVYVGDPKAYDSKVGLLGVSKQWINY